MRSQNSWTRTDMITLMNPNKHTPTYVHKLNDFVWQTVDIRFVHVKVFVDIRYDEEIWCRINTSIILFSCGFKGFCITYCLTEWTRELKLEYQLQVELDSNLYHELYSTVSFKAVLWMPQLDVLTLVSCCQRFQNNRQKLTQQRIDQTISGRVYRLKWTL